MGCAKWIVGRLKIVNVGRSALLDRESQMLVIVTVGRHHSAGFLINGTGHPSCLLIIVEDNCLNNIIPLSILGCYFLFNHQ